MTGPKTKTGREGVRESEFKMAITTESNTEADRCLWKQSRLLREKVGFSAGCSPNFPSAFELTTFALGVFERVHVIKFF